MLMRQNKKPCGCWCSISQRIATVFEGDVKSGEQQTFEFNPAAACDCMFIYRLQTEQGSYYGKAMMVR